MVEPGGGVVVEELLESLEESVTVYDRDARFVYANAAGARPFGRSARELLGKRPWDLASSDEVSPFRLALEAVLAGGPRTRTTTWVAAWDRWYEADIYPHPVGALVLARDVTTARRAHDELARSEARFRAMVESAPEAIVILDLTTNRFVDMNRETEELFGRSRTELLGLSPDDLSPRKQPGDVDAAKMIATLRERVLRGEQVAFEWTVIGPRGKPLTVELRARRLPSSDQTVLVRTSIFDITAQKRAQEQLQEVQRLEAIARLAGGVAHDFNNMLTVIIAGIQLALHQLPKGHAACEDLENAMNAAERSALITRQLLTFGRNQTAKPRVLDVTAYIDRVAPVLRRLVGEDVEIVLDLARPLASTLIDPAHVEQVLVNLVANARDAMPKGGRITIQTANVVLDSEYERLHNGVPPGRYVLVSVADTGEGIPAAAKPHIFEPFFTTKALDRGTGLGLATVYGIVKANSGHIWVYSELGYGSTFKVYLPTADDTIPSDDLDPSQRAMNLRGTETILLVEDDDDVRAVLRKALQRAGYTIIEAKNAGEALLIVEQHEGAIHLMLTDVVMSRMTGPQLVARLRPIRPQMRIVYISGYNDARLDAPEHAGTYEAMLTKPVSNDVLLACIRDVLDRPRGTG
jgi:PAS domain S-box-containing protein